MDFGGGTGVVSFASTNKREIINVPSSTLSLTNWIICSNFSSNQLLEKVLARYKVASPELHAILRNIVNVAADDKSATTTGTFQ